MNILHLSTHDSGGAAIGALRVHENLKAAGYNSMLFVKYKSNATSDALLYQEKQNFVVRLFKYIYRFFKTRTAKNWTSDSDYVFFNKDETKPSANARKILQQVPAKPDIIILYWVSDFINSKTMYELNKLANAPILWYLMDNSPMTGGCHYNWDCNRFQTTCGKCPALYSTKLEDASYKNLKLKKKYLSGTHLMILTGTSLAMEQAKSSALFFDKPITKLLLGLDSNIFRPLEKKIAKETFSLPLGKKVIFFGATYLQERRKGGTELIKSLELLYEKLPAEKKQEIILLIAGKNFSAFENIAFEKKYLGFIQDERILASAYQAADIFVCPSIEDAGPMMVIEALACGTPVVAFDLGFAHDFIDTKTGYLAQKANAEDLSKGLLYLLQMNPVEYEQMSEHCAKTAINENSVSKQLSVLKKIFEQAKSN